MSKRILIVSKFRQFLGGVESHIESLRTGLETRGYETDMFSSEDVANAGGNVFDVSAIGVREKAVSALNMYWNRTARVELQAKIDRFEPTLVHYHSIYHQLSPSVLGVGAAPSVMTLHDYKFAAPCYTLYRDGMVCQECVGRRVALPGIKYRCVGGSAGATLLCAAEDLLYKGRYVDSIDRFVVPSRYSESVMKDAGMPDHKLTVVPWGVDLPALTHSAYVREAAPTFAFIGRLHETKGLAELLRAWELLPVDLSANLVVAGAGDLAPLVQKLAAADSRVRFLGLVSRSDASELMAVADLVIVPSLFPESMGLSALESLVRRTPVLSSGRGALSDLRGAGVLEVEPSSDAISSVLVRLARSGEELHMLRVALSSRDLSMYTNDSMLDRMEAVYDGVLA